MNIENTPHTTTVQTEQNARRWYGRLERQPPKVRVHFSTTSTETMSDKIKRMLKNEVRQMRAFCKLDEKVLDKMFLELYDETFLEQISLYNV